MQEPVEKEEDKKLIPLAPDEATELKDLELKLRNSHKNVLRKLIAVWIF